MAQVLTDSERENAITPEIKSAAEEVLNHFYREIAAEARDQPVDDAETVVVQPDDGTEQVRRSADLLYRTLFGDESYNRHTMRSAIEVTLPVQPESGIR